MKCHQICDGLGISLSVWMWRSQHEPRSCSRQEFSNKRSAFRGNWAQPDINLANRYFERQHVVPHSCCRPVPRLLDSLAERQEHHLHAIGVNDASAGRHSRPSDKRLLSLPAAPISISRVLQYLFTSHHTIRMHHRVMITSLLTQS